ncbi:MAG: HEAT repeat domain-containing protein, partial [Okeania sp. SIO2D1]|nr:HEAT repeat domain-containing protein [Okeania sp. SIO2D1]
MDNQDLNQFNIQPMEESPLDHLGEEPPKPDPEEMLPLLTSSEPSQ